MLSEKKKKNDDDIATLSAVSKVTSKKYLDDTGLGHFTSLIISFVKSYAAAKTHNHDGVYAAKSHNHDAGNITSGTLPIHRGGTGATTAKQAQVNLLKNDMHVSSTSPYDDSCFAFAEQPGNENATNGVLYRRRAKDVWTYFNNKIKSLYLPLTGGTVTGLLKTPGGTMVHNASGTSGTVGYVNIAEFNLAGTTYQNMPIQLDVFRRRMSMVTRLYIWFDPVDSSDPAIAHLGYEGAGTDTDFYMYKSATSTWQLYIKKAEGYDNVGIAEYKTNFLYMHHKITFKDVQVSSVPSGAIAGKYCDAMRATAIKDAGDGRNITFNYSADGMQDANWYAVWNGAELKAMSKANMQSSLGILLSAYPVGAVYISWSSTSPASLFGGSWVAITGRFPYFNAGTSIGGANSHTLSINEMPSHNHSIHMRVGWGNGGGASETIFQTSSPTSGGNKWTESTNYTGGSAAHNNMPAYQTLYAWRRTA